MKKITAVWMPLWIGFLVYGCTHSPTLPVENGVQPAASSPQPQAEVVGELDAPWLSPFNTDHPLVGKIYIPSQHREASINSLMASVRRARFVLLGEKHDNPDHHRFQAFIYRKIFEAHRKPALAVEMVETKQQSVLDQFISQHPTKAEPLAGLLGWKKSGWPDWKMYQPIFQIALDHHLPLWATNLSRNDARSLVMEGEKSPAFSQIVWGKPLAEEQQKALFQEMRDNHCGQLPEKMIPGMALAQQARDATMANVLLEKTDKQGAILIAGAGHVRRDRGIPRFLIEHESKPTWISIGFIEVDPSWKNPDDYAQRYHSSRIPFDLVWFTPRASNEDPCQGFAHPHKK
jgi:uncharacterized iron-regulated protein